MSVLALRLAGPLQSWGSRSRFVRRTTESSPTKSGIIGLLAAAQGLRRSDPIEELVGLRFGARVDQGGQLLRDFQTARRPKTQRDGTVEWQPMPLSERYYLSDAVFLAVLEGPEPLLEGLHEAIRRPFFPLFLGRRSCPPAGPIAIGVFPFDLDEALRRLPWQASEREQRRRRSPTVDLDVTRDAAPGEIGHETVRDQPVSFDPNRRLYAWRSVVREVVTIDNPHGVGLPADEHDPMTAARG